MSRSLNVTDGALFMRQLNIQKTLATVLFASTTLLAACSDSGVTTDEFIDGPFRDALQTKRLLSTGAAATSENFWFCTFLAGGVYVDRLPLYLWEDGTGSLDGVELNWATNDESVSIESDTVDYALSDIEFANRVSSSDMFTAKLNLTDSMACDLVGPPRFQVLDDDVSANNAFFTNGGTETLDVLLITGVDETGDNFWRCQSTSAAGIAEAYSLRFSDRFAFRDGVALDWDDVKEDAIEIELSATQTETWTEVTFRNLLNPELGLGFSAIQNGDGNIDCEWEGQDRASSL